MPPPAGCHVPHRMLWPEWLDATPCPNLAGPLDTEPGRTPPYAVLGPHRSRTGDPCRPRSGYRVTTSTHRDRGSSGSGRPNESHRPHSGWTAPDNSSNGHVRGSWSADSTPVHTPDARPPTELPSRRRIPGTPARTAFRPASHPWWHRGWHHRRYRVHPQTHRGTTAANSWPTVNSGRTTPP